MSYAKISQGEYDKAKGQLRLQFNGVLNCFRCHGLDIYVEGAIDECVELAEQFAMRVRGKQIPIKTRNNPTRKPTE